jgi:hypothetical protein
MCIITTIKFIFKVCKSVHHRTIQIIHQPDAKSFQFIILTFIYSSKCFGRFPAHHQELDDCSGSFCFYLHFVVIVLLCSWSDRVGRTDSLKKNFFYEKLVGISRSSINLK